MSGAVGVDADEAEVAIEVGLHRFSGATLQWLSAGREHVRH